MLSLIFGALVQTRPPDRMSERPCFASKQMFSPDPFTRVVCIHEMDGTCIKETIHVGIHGDVLCVTYSQHKFGKDDCSYAENINKAKDERCWELKAGLESRMGELKEQIRGLPFVSPELGPIAAKMVDSISARRQ